MKPRYRLLALSGLGRATITSGVVAVPTFLFTLPDGILSQLMPWGFDLSEIAVPVLLSYGLKDAFTPPAHGHWLAAHLPTATVEVNAEAGHTGTDPEAEVTRELTWLSGTSPGGSAHG